jgi:hypothetical protein
MVHGALIIAAGQALDAGAHAVGATGAAIAVVTLLLGVVAMFALLFWTQWGHATGGDPTGAVEQERRQRLNQNPAYSG